MMMLQRVGTAEEEQIKRQQYNKAHSQFGKTKNKRTGRKGDFLRFYFPGLWWSCCCLLLFSSSADVSNFPFFLLSGFKAKIQFGEPLLMSKIDFHQTGEQLGINATTECYFMGHSENPTFIYRLLFFDIPSQCGIESTQQYFGLFN